MNGEFGQEGAGGGAERCVCPHPGSLQRADLGVLHVDLSVLVGNLRRERLHLHPDARQISSQRGVVP